MVIMLTRITFDRAGTHGAPESRSNRTQIDKEDAGLLKHNECSSKVYKIFFRCPAKNNIPLNGISLPQGPCQQTLHSSLVESRR